MDMLETAISIMKPGCYMASVDLKDAYCTVPIDSSHQKYLKFCFEGECFQYTCLPNLYTCLRRLANEQSSTVYVISSRAIKARDSHNKSQNNMAVCWVLAPRAELELISRPYWLVIFLRVSASMMHRNFSTSRCMKDKKTVEGYLPGQDMFFCSPLRRDRGRVCVSR